MKRGGYIKRKTPLRSHKIGQLPKPMARKPLRRVSKKRAKENALYLKIRKEYLEAHPKCEAYLLIWGYMDPAPIPASEDVHHKFGRYGKNLLDTSTWIAVSRRAHDWIHTYSNQARELGLLAPKNM